MSLLATYQLHCPDAVARLPSITCLRCGTTSYHPVDVHEHYCGHCHIFHDDERGKTMISWRTMDIETQCKAVRTDINTLLAAVKAIRDQASQAARQTTTATAAAVPDHAEMIANTMLAYRHLEDARMRLGKVIQAHDGGKTAYPS